MWLQCLAYKGELDRRFVTDSEFVVACRDASGLFQEAYPALDPVSAFVHLAVESWRAATRRAPAETVAGLIAFLRDGVLDLPVAQVLADLPGGVRPVGQDVVRADARSSAAGTWHPDAVHDLGEHRGVASLSGGDDSGKNVEGGVDGEMDLGRQAAARASDRMVGRLGRKAVLARPARIVNPLFRAPAACWCARQIVESTDTSHSMCPAASALTCNFFRTRAQVPSICQRRKSVYAVSHGPYRSGTSRHGEPVRARHQIPSKHCLRSRGFRPILGSGGNTASSRAHCSSVRSPRATP